MTRTDIAEDLLDLTTASPTFTKPRLAARLSYRKSSRAPMIHIERLKSLEATSGGL